MAEWPKVATCCVVWNKSRIGAGCPVGTLASAVPSARHLEDGLQKRTIARWTWFMLLVLGAIQVAAQQDEGPILRPKTPAQATLLVMCDLACNWKLDGEAKGSIEAGGSAKVKVQFGQHMVVATTEDGLDQAQQIIKVHEKEQTVVSIELKPVRDARLEAEQQAKNEAAEEARERVAREKSSGIWADPETNLTWAKEDSYWGETWQQATDYCRSLQLAGYTDWLLPTIDELQGIYDRNTNVDGDHVNGNLKLTLPYSEWSSSQEYASGEAWTYDFRNGWRTSYQLDIHYHNRALCVRHSGG